MITCASVSTQVSDELLASGKLEVSDRMEVFQTSRSQVPGGFRQRSAHGAKRVRSKFVQVITEELCPIAPSVPSEQATEPFVTPEKSRVIRVQHNYVPDYRQELLIRQHKKFRRDQARQEAMVNRYRAAVAGRTIPDIFAETLSVSDAEYEEWLRLPA